MFTSEPKKRDLSST